MSITDTVLVAEYLHDALSITLNLLDKWTKEKSERYWVKGMQRELSNDLTKVYFYISTVPIH